MNKLERRILRDSILIGGCLTIIVIAAEIAGVLVPFEAWLYDKRARLCQHFTPPPTDRLMHLDVNEGALEVIGVWPWPRSRLAEILDELRLARPKAVALDIIFSEAQPEAAEDQALAASIGRLKNVLLPVAFEPRQRGSPLYQAVRDQLIANPKLTEKQLGERLGLQSTQLKELSAKYLPARREAIYHLVQKELSQQPLTLEQLSQRILKEEPGLSSPLSVILEKQFGLVKSQLALSRFSFPTPPEMPYTSPTQFQAAPLPIYCDVIATTAFVTYPHFEGSIVRSVPLFMEIDGRVYPQFGLALACQVLGVAINQLKIERDFVVIPNGNTQINIPTAGTRWSSEGQLVGPLFDVPWFGKREWETMYDYPAHKDSAQHLSIIEAWNPCVTRRKIIANNTAADRAILYLLGDDSEQFEGVPGKRLGLDARRTHEYFAHLPPPEDVQKRTEMAKHALQTLQDEKLIEDLAEVKDSELTANQKEQRDELLLARRGLVQFLEQSQLLRAQLADQRSNLARAVRDKAIIVGWTFTGANADFVPTSLHDRCPGAVVHGAIFNAIMTGETWRRAPQWVTLLVAAGLGMITSVVVGRIPPTRGALVAIALLGAYAAFNGLILFDKYNLIVGAAAPITAIAAVWSGGTLVRIVVEGTERKRITKRFRTYVDPRLVTYVQENPEDARMEGEKRELSVCFTDLAGFTTLSERLGEQIVPLLNEFLGMMVPVIREQHRGLVNKFLGDGIMFFFGAPIRDPEHAIDACGTLLDMHAALKVFNQRLELRGLPPVAMRAGMVSGDVVVGDAGSGDASDYTVIGDNVNLASRLEGANKATGTYTMINDRAAELVRDQFLVRPLGKLRVKGKSEGVMTYELLCRVDEATDGQRKLVDLATPIVRAYTEHDLQRCLAAIEEYEWSFGPCKFCDMYRDLCNKEIGAPSEKFDGMIVLMEK